jgi:hypothetical protein
MQLRCGLCLLARLWSWLTLATGGSRAVSAALVDLPASERDRSSWASISGSMAAAIGEVLAGFAVRETLDGGLKVTG